jgi:hypothetical protein
MVASQGTRPARSKVFDVGHDSDRNRFGAWRFRLFKQWSTGQYRTKEVSAF